MLCLLRELDDRLALGVLQNVHHIVHIGVRAYGGGSEHVADSPVSTEAESVPSTDGGLACDKRPRGGREMRRADGRGGMKRKAEPLAAAAGEVNGRGDECGRDVGLCPAEYGTVSGQSIGFLWGQQAAQLPRHVREGGGDAFLVPLLCECSQKSPGRQLGEAFKGGAEHPQAQLCLFGRLAHQSPLPPEGAEGSDLEGAPIHVSRAYVAGRRRVSARPRHFGIIVCWLLFVGCQRIGGSDRGRLPDSVARVRKWKWDDDARIESLNRAWTFGLDLGC